jgi:hypothetical protein
MKTYPNKQRYHQILRTMSPQDRLMKAFELSEVFVMQEAVLDHGYLDARNIKLGLEKELDDMRRFIDNE